MILFQGVSWYENGTFIAISSYPGYPPKPLVGIELKRLFPTDFSMNGLCDLSSFHIYVVHDVPYLPFVIP